MAGGLRVQFALPRGAIHNRTLGHVRLGLKGHSLISVTARPVGGRPKQQSSRKCITLQTVPEASKQGSVPARSCTHTLQASENCEICRGTVIAMKFPSSWLRAAAHKIHYCGRHFTMNAKKNSLYSDRHHETLKGGDARAGDCLGQVLTASPGVAKTSAPPISDCCPLGLERLSRTTCQRHHQQKGRFGSCCAYQGDAYICMQTVEVRGNALRYSEKPNRIRALGCEDQRYC